MDYDQKLTELGLTLPPAPTPVGSYVPCVESNGQLFISGQIPRAGGEIQYRGKIGEDLQVKDGYEASKLCVLNALAAAKAHLGTLNRIKRVVRLSGFVRSGEEFRDQPKVIDGASDLLVSIFGDSGKHARVSVGVNELPGGSTVEIEILFELTKP